MESKYFEEINFHKINFWLGKFLWILLFLETHENLSSENLSYYPICEIKSFRNTVQFVRKLRKIEELTMILYAKRFFLDVFFLFLFFKLNFHLISRCYMWTGYLEMISNFSQDISRCGFIATICSGDFSTGRILPNASKCLILYFDQIIWQIYQPEQTQLL